MVGKLQGCGSDSEPSKSQETPGKLQEILEISQVFYRVGGNFRDVDSYSFMSKLKDLVFGCQLTFPRSRINF